MELPANGDKLHFGNADHCLDHTKKKGVISVQGSWRDSDIKPVFAIIGGTGDYRKARGTVDALERTALCCDALVRTALTAAQPCATAE
jgi:hypothetical protein